jgi:hypothetical protein
MTLRAHTLWLFGLTLSLGAGAGCGGDGSDAKIGITWDVAYVGPAATTCEALGTPTVHLEARASGNGQLYAFDFDCTPGSGITGFIPSGMYDITLSLLDLKKRAVASTGGMFTVNRHGVTELDPVEFQVQAFQVSWLLVVQPAGGTMSTPTCAGVGVKTIEFSAQLSGEPGGETFQFDCVGNPGQGMTSAVRTGTYAYQFSLLDAAGTALTQGDIKSVVVGGTTLTAVPPERFAFQ